MKIREVEEGCGFDIMVKPRCSKTRTLYQINPNFVLRQIGGEYAIIPVGDECLISNAVMIPNDSAVLLWNEFSSPRTEEEAVMRMLQDYEGSVEKIRDDVHRFVKESLSYRVMREVS